MKRTSLLCLVAAAVVAAPMFLGGCAGDRVTVGELRRNPTPELAHTARSTGQVRNDHARIWDTSGRMLWDDIERLLLLNANRQNSPYVAPAY
jgi:hypothetical protein